MTRSISRSSISFSACSLNSPLACLARASWIAFGRSRLPTWSARNGGLFRFMFSLPAFGNRSAAPDFVGDLHNHAELRPLLFLGEDIALLARGKAALRRQAELIERHELRGLIDPAL